MPGRFGTPPSVTVRVLAILGAFVPGDPTGLSLNEISQRTRLTLSITFRLVRELQDGRMLERGADLRYRIGPRVGELLVR